MPGFNEFEFLSADKKTMIHVREIVPEGMIKGYVQIAHGVAEYINRYDDFMEFLASKGYAVAGNDHLGHGRSVSSEENRLFFAEENGWDIVVDDMKTLHDTLKNRYPNLPAILFGHSMGSFLARTYIIKYPFDFDEAIICGTGQESPLVIAAGKMMANRECRKNGAKVPSVKMNNLAFGGYNKSFEQRTPSDWLSKNQENVDRYIADELCGGIPTAGLFRDMMGGLQFIAKKENLAKMSKNLPVFLIAGAKDPVGSMGREVAKVKAMFEAAGMKNVSMKLYEDDRHEILNEDDHETVYHDIVNWIGKQL